MFPPTEVPDEWDFYPARVDDAPASILLNMWFGNHAPLEGADTLYWARISLRNPGEHGMGDGAEAEQVQAVEDRFGEWAKRRGLYFVGRLRNRGTWQLTFYGPAGLEAEMRAQLQGALGGGDRKGEVGSKADAEWRYLRDFLWPTPERLRWMGDRSVVDSLKKHGDVFEQPRRVDHWAYFPAPEDRDAFVAAAQKLGFALQAKGDDDAGERRYSAQVFRTDPVRLEEIHSVIMTLHELAEAHRGDYDGWETHVVRKRTDRPTRALPE